MSLPAKKSLGQNFLNSPKAIRTMVSGGQLGPNDIVIEIGPGKGALTRAFLETGARVIAIELDPRMIEYLNETFRSEITSGQLSLIQEDILNIDPHTLTLGKAYKVIANIPYYITGAILRYFLEHEHQPSVMCLLMQQEVARRIVSRDGKESILSLSVKAYGTPRYLGKVPRGAFTPAPKVDSAIVAITDIARDHFVSQEHERRFFALIKEAFAQKRKQLVNNVSLFGKERLIAFLTEHGYPGTTRAEDLPIDLWLTLSKLED